VRTHSTPHQRWITKLKRCSLKWGVVGGNVLWGRGTSRVGCVIPQPPPVTDAQQDEQSQTTRKSRSVRVEQKRPHIQSIHNKNLHPKQTQKKPTTNRSGDEERSDESRLILSSVSLSQNSAHTSSPIGTQTTKSHLDCRRSWRKHPKRVIPPRATTNLYNKTHPPDPNIFWSSARW